MSNEKEIEEEAARIRSYEGRGIGLAYRTAVRICVRSMRIFSGLLLGVLALWPGSSSYDTAHKPLSTLTLADVAGVIFLGGLALVLVSLAFSAAFGSGPSLQDEDERRHRIARDRVGKRSWAKAKALTQPPAIERAEPRLSNE